MKIVKKFIKYHKDNNSPVLFAFGCGLIGILTKTFLSDTKYYPSFLNDLSPILEGLLLFVFLLIVLYALYYLSKKIYFLLKEIFE
mgnify:CR=1 FL=1